MSRSSSWLVRTACLALAVAAPMSVSAQWAVFDSSNYAENVLQAARELQQIDNQVRSLQNETVMLENMARNLQSLNYSSLNAMVSDLQRVGTLMNEAQGVSFDVNATRSAVAQDFPEQYAAAVDTDQLVADAHLRWQNSMDAFRQTMLVQSRIASNVQADTGTLSSLVDASQNATGALQAQQATNQLLALSTKQQLQIQTLMAAQYRAAALEQARNAEADEEARAETARFLGTGNVYSPE